MMKTGLVLTSSTSVLSQGFSGFGKSPFQSIGLQNMLSGSSSSQSQAPFGSLASQTRLGQSFGSLASFPIGGNSMSGPFGGQSVGLPFGGNGGGILSHGSGGQHQHPEIIQELLANGGIDLGMQPNGMGAIAVPIFSSGGLPLSSGSSGAGGGLPGLPGIPPEIQQLIASHMAGKVGGASSSSFGGGGFAPVQQQQQAFSWPSSASASTTPIFGESWNIGNTPSWGGRSPTPQPLPASASWDALWDPPFPPSSWEWEASSVNWEQLQQPQPELPLWQPDIKSPVSSEPVVPVPATEFPLVWDGGEPAGEGNGGPIEEFVDLGGFFEEPPSGPFLPGEDSSRSDIARATPKTNFYDYVNAWWLNDEDMVIPDGYPMWGTFMEANYDSEQLQVQLLKDLSAGVPPEAGHPASLSEHEVEILRRAWDATQTEFAKWAAGGGDYSAVHQTLRQLDTALPAEGATEQAWAEGLATAFSQYASQGIGLPLQLTAALTLQHPDKLLLTMDPGPLSMPAQALYLDPMLAMQRMWFAEHVQQAGELVGLEDPEFGERVLRFETKLAAMDMGQKEKRAIEQYSDMTTLRGLAQSLNGLRTAPSKADLEPAVLTPQQVALTDTLLSNMADNLGLEWAMRANTATNYPGSGDNWDTVTVNDADYFRRLFGLLFDEDEETRKDVKAYLEYQAIDSAQRFSTQELQESFFDFYRSKLGNVQKSNPDLEALHELTGSMPHKGKLDVLVGKAYVARHFPAGNKREAQAIFDNLKQQLGKQIEGGEDEFQQSTKEEALDKLDAFSYGVGFPDTWESYARLDIPEGASLAEASASIQSYLFRERFLGRLNSPADPDRWHLGPQNVNAYFDPLANAMVFPAGILGEPFLYTGASEGMNFPPRYDWTKITPELINAMNYGTLGWIAGHEMLHGFDDQGRKFDADGLVRNWWTSQDDLIYDEVADKMAEQAEAWSYTPKAGASGPMPAGAVPMMMGPDGKLVPLPEGMAPPALNGAPPAGAVPMMMGPDGKLVPLPEGMAPPAGTMGGAPPAGAVPMMMGPDGKLVPLPKGMASPTSGAPQAVPMMMGPDGKLVPLPEGMAPPAGTTGGAPPAGAVPMMMGPDGKLVPLPEGVTIAGGPPSGAMALDGKHGPQAIPMMMGPDGKLVPLPEGMAPSGGAPGQGGMTFRMDAEMTMGENLADVGGLQLAVEALKETPSFKNAPPASQKQQLQFFFVAYANALKTIVPDMILGQVLANDPHGPFSFRGNLVKNVDAFYEAFDVNEGDPMYLAPEDRVVLWAK